VEFSLDPARKGNAPYNRLSPIVTQFQPIIRLHQHVPGSRADIGVDKADAAISQANKEAG
jgi:hypothetical protein